MKKTDLEKHKGKKIAGGFGNARGGVATALDRREQAMDRKRELLTRLQEKKGK